MGKIKDFFGILGLAIDLIPGPTRVRSLGAREEKNEDIIYFSETGEWPVGIFPYFAGPPDPRYRIRDLKIVSEEGAEPAFCASFIIERIDENEAAEYMTGMIGRCGEVVEIRKDHASAKAKFEDRDWFVVGYWEKEKKTDSVNIELNWLSYGRSGESR